MNRDSIQELQRLKQLQNKQLERLANQKENHDHSGNYKDKYEDVVGKYRKLDQDYQKMRDKYKSIALRSKSSSKMELKTPFIENAMLQEALNDLRKINSK